MKLIVNDESTLEDILAQFDAEEVKAAEKGSTSLAFMKANAAKAISVKWGLKGEYRQKLSEKTSLAINSLAAYATVAFRIPEELQDDRLPFNLYREASKTGDTIPATKLIRWALDNYGTSNFTYSQFNAKKNRLKELQRNDASPDAMDSVIDTWQEEEKIVEPLHHDTLDVPVVVQNPSELEEFLPVLYEALVKEWIRLSNNGERKLLMRGKFHADWWEQDDN